MIIIILSILVHLIAGSIMAFVIAFIMTWALNPTATPGEIFGFWKSNFEKNRKEGRLF